jgi:uncharacterized protein with HEPN domain
VSRSARDRLIDIQTAITKVYAFRPALRGEHSDMAVSAILREIGIIGEAVNALPEAVTAKRPEIAWRQIGAMRNFLIHEYFNIDEAVVEDVIANDLDPLTIAVTALRAPANSEGLRRQRGCGFPAFRGESENRTNAPAIRCEKVIAPPFCVSPSTGAAARVCQSSRHPVRMSK